MVKPYIDKVLGGCVERTFISTEGLVWHKDKEGRKVILLKGKCSFILDNNIPINMIIGKEYFIPKEVWHKIIFVEEGSVIRILRDF